MRISQSYMSLLRSPKSATLVHSARKSVLEHRLMLMKLRFTLMKQLCHLGDSSIGVQKCGERVGGGFAISESTSAKQMKESKKRFVRSME